MYCDFYQLNEKPFNVTPDPKFLYLNARYREALASLHYGITERKGFVTLIGEAGTGKTTILNRLLAQLDDRTKTILIFNTNVTFEDILEYIFAEFDLPIHSGKKLYMLQRLNSFLLDELRGGGNVALLIDEAQDLEFSVLEDLRLLSNLETAKEKILQIVLSGQPELGVKLGSPVLRQLRQRIAINCRLLPLSREELSEYIRFRLEAAGCADARVFTRDAEDEIWRFSRGIPRLVNVVCDNALVIGYALGKKRLAGDVIEEAAADLIAAQQDAPEVPAVPMQPQADEVDLTSKTRPRPGRAIGTWAVAGVVAAALTIGLLSMGRSMLRQRADAPVHAVAERAAAPPRQVIQPGGYDPTGLGAGVSQAGDPADASDAEVRRVARATGGGDRNPAAAGPVIAPGDTDPQPAPAAAGGAPPNAQLAPAPQLPDPRRVRAGSEPGEPAKDVVRRTAPDTDSDRPGIRPPREPGGGTRKDPPVRVADAARPVELAQLPPEAGQPGELTEAAGGVQAPVLEARAQAAPASAPNPAQVSDGAPAESGGLGNERASAGALALTGQRLDQVSVRAGQSLSQVAIGKYGQASYTILDLMKLANPEIKDIDVVSAGQTVSLPELSSGFSVLADANGSFGVLIHSTPSSGRAKALAAALSAHGFPVAVTPANLGARKTVYRVVAGNASSAAEAADVGKDVQRAFREDDRLARLGRY